MSCVVYNNNFIEMKYVVSQCKCVRGQCRVQMYVDRNIEKCAEREIF